MKILVFGGGSDIAKVIKHDGYETILLSKQDCDVTSKTRVFRMVRDHEPDIVVNLAGVCNFQSLKDMSFGLLEDEINTNLFGAINIAYACIKHNVKKVIFIGSISSLFGKKNQIGYGATKRALVSIVQTLSKEGLESYCISPGAISTKLRDRLFPDEDKKRRMRPEEISSLINDCIDGKYKSGDNIIIHKFGYETYIRVNNDDPWNAYIIQEDR